MFKTVLNNFFKFKNSENIELEQTLKSMTIQDVVREINISKNINKKQENTSEMIEKKDELVLNQAEVEKVEEVVATEPAEVENKEEQAQELEDAQTVSEETESQEEIKNEEEGIEPAEESETVETEEQEPQKEKEVEQEEPQEPALNTQDVKVEVEQPTNVSLVEETKETPVNESLKVDLAVNSEKESLIKEINQLKAEKLEQEIKLQKMDLAKEVEKDFAGLPAKTEDKVELIYEIKNSSISENAKEFIFNSLKSLSAQNLESCQEIGHSQEVETDEKDEREQKIKKAIDEHGLTENQAFLFINGDRTLAEAKKASEKANRKRK